MTDPNITLAFMTEGWQVYQEKLSKALAPLTDEQLALRAAPNLRSINELARHIIAVRAGWYHFVLHEGDHAFRAIAEWNQTGQPARSAKELVDGLATTWAVMDQALAGWSPVDLQALFEDEDDGKVYQVTRGWVVWHVIEHDLHHGGEIGYSLGMHGISGLDI